MENEIKLVCGESIDEVVDMLLKEKENGNHVFCSFNDVILYSDDVTLDSAYMSICGCTKSDFIKKQELIQMFQRKIINQLKLMRN